MLWHQAASSKLEIFTNCWLLTRLPVIINMSRCNTFLSMSCFQKLKWNMFKNRQIVLCATVLCFKPSEIQRTAYACNCFMCNNFGHWAQVGNQFPTLKKKKKKGSEQMFWCIKGDWSCCNSLIFFYKYKTIVSITTTYFFSFLL